MLCEIYRNNCLDICFSTGNGFLCLDCKLCSILQPHAQTTDGITKASYWQMNVFQIYMPICGAETKELGKILRQRRQCGSSHGNMILFGAFKVWGLLCREKGRSSY